jgi:peptidoglycan/LPS O-acetylase OafA/YrhL
MSSGVVAGAGYRPDIDGLRAIAVISVIVYHINKDWLPGGFVGVDVFFVISGFLITSIIWRNLQGDTFSLADFYLRRIRRIVPVMMVVVATTLLAGALLLLPDALDRLSTSSLYALGSAANIYFWLNLNDDYFAESSDQEPLLHLWSLGVEEQFYLIWPLLLMLIVSVRRRPYLIALSVSVAIAVASYALGEALNETNAKFSYFMLPTRAGELMTGAILAIVQSKMRRGAASRQALLPEIVALCGLGLIGYSLFFLDDTSPFPGWNALYPCIGAAALIGAGSRSRLLGYSLAIKPIVAVGLLSYSLYLWHWPILAFVRYFYGTVSSAHALAAVVGMLVLSWLSYRFVEQPARHVVWAGRKQVAALLVAPAVLVAVPALAIAATGGMKAWIESSPSYTQGLERLTVQTAPASRYEFNCQLARHDPRILEKDRCLVGANKPAPGARKILLWGDSHAAHHVGAVAAIGKFAGVQVRNASHSSCPPVFGGDYSQGKYKAGCTQFREYVRQHVGHGEFDVVMLGATWTAYDRSSSFREDVARTVAEIRQSGANVILLGKVPYFLAYNRECDMRWLRFGTSRCNQIAVTDEPLPINEYLRDLAAADSGISYLALDDVICDGGLCRAYLEGEPLYYDSSHLSMDGSKRVGEYMLRSGLAESWLAAMSTPRAIALGRVGPSPPSGFKTSALREPLPDNFILPFRYHRRFDNGERGRDGRLGQRAERRVMVEYLEIGPNEVEASLLRALEADGFSVIGREAAERSNGFELERENARISLRIIQNANGTVAPNANGTLHLIWRARDGG